MLSIKENAKPVLKPCKMKCDTILHKKLEKFELTKFLNVHSTNLLIGKPKSGKTSLLYSFFQSKELFRRVYHNVYLFQPNHSRTSMNDDIFGTLPEEQKYDELTYENLKDVMTAIKNEESKYNNCIIFDDMGSYLKNKETMTLFKDLVFNRRHYHTSIFFLVQTFYSVPREIRRLFSNMFIFRTSKEELQNIFEEVIEIKSDIIPEISKLVYDKPYEYLFVNTDTQRMFKGFNEILIS
jgi:hypothetical protein